MENWQLLGFEKNPYEVRALSIEEADKSLFYGRSKETATFLSIIRGGDNGIIAILGSPGVGKTSFFNFQQNTMLRLNKLGFGTVLPCRQPCSLSPGETARDLADRIVRATLNSIRDYCANNDVAMPRAARETEKWLSHKPDKSGYSFSISSPFGGGGWSRDKQIPNVADATTQNYYEIFQLIVEEAVSTLGPRSILVAIENLESLDVADVARVFMALRDNFFAVPGVIFVIMGRDNLVQELERIDERIAQRVRQPTIILPAFTSQALHELVELRIKKYRYKDSLSPLSNEIHQIIFDASEGIARLALQRSEELVNMIFVDIYGKLVESFNREDTDLTPEELDEIVVDSLEAVLVDQRIPNQYAYSSLLRQSLKRIAPKLAEDDAIPVALSSMRFGKSDGKDDIHGLDKIKEKVGQFDEDGVFVPIEGTETFSQRVLAKAIELYESD